MHETYQSQIEAIRDLCHNRLSRYSNTVGKVPSQTFLFEGGFFCGVQYQLGHFRAKWMIAESQVYLYRDQEQIDVVMLGEQRRAA